MSKVFYQQRRDPQALGTGWETAVVVLTAVLLLAVLAALVGIGVVSVVFGHGWIWPHDRQDAIRLLVHLARPHTREGLTGAQRARLAARPVLLGGVAIAELAAVALVIAGGVVVGRYRRPSDARGGMATRAEAQQVLGIARLRGARALIRPDRYTTHPKRRLDAGRRSS